ncbi:MAG: FAD-dependent oxidoreductase, partial [Phycisphaeraceae bacterium]|nr:FAD-dependent oxidoreductase [Phycisphaeraceae bacterium]
MKRPRLCFVGSHLARQPGWVTTQNEILAGLFREAGYEVRETSSQLRPLNRLADVLLSLWRWRRDVDVVVISVFSGRGFLLADAASSLARRLGLPQIQVLRGGALPEMTMTPNEEWFAQRAWSVSANKVVPRADGTTTAVTTLATRIEHPSSAEEIAAIVKSLPATTPIACVCGGHEASGTALVAARGAVILDLGGLKSIEFESADDGTLVTVGSGVVFRELVEAVKGEGGALPVGTGPGVGVAGYALNGGLSSYFSRRLGLLGQRAVKMTVVTADGEIRVLTPEDELFTAMLGAGSALAIVVDITFRVADASTIKGAEQRVFGYETRAQAVEFSKKAMQFMKERVMPNDSVSLEIVVTGTKAIVATTVFYDTFEGGTAEFVEPLEAIASEMELPTFAEAHWGSWYEAAAAL